MKLKKAQFGFAVYNFYFAYYYKLSSTTYSLC